MTKFAVVVVFLLIVVSLGVALRHLLTSGERSPATVKALTVRIGMSLVLFFLLLIGYKAGILHPHGLNQGQAASSAAVVKK